MFRTRKQSLLGELIELRATGEAGSPSALSFLSAAGGGAYGADSVRRHGPVRLPDAGRR
jgi:hypothetical protein